MDLNQISLQEPLRFITDPHTPEKRRTGIFIKETSEDGNLERVHRFNPDGSYRGYFDRDIETGASTRGVDYSYKTRTADGDHRYYKVSREGSYQAGTKEVVSGKSLPSIGVDGKGVASLQKSEKLPWLRPPDTYLQDVEAEARLNNQTVAELYGKVDGSLADEPSERDMQRPRQLF